jgi:hypothetical protein
MKIRNRRKFIKQSAGLALSLPFFSSFMEKLQDKQYPRILFRLGWDFKDNNDLAYVPALYRMAQKTILNTEFYLWLHDSDNEVTEMLNNNFINVKIVTGDIDASGQPTTDELKTILSETDLLIYSPGAATQVDWANNNETGIETGSLHYCFDNSIPYAIFGIGEIPENDQSLEGFLKLVNGANYILSTSSSIDKALKEKNIKISKLQTSPNPLFAFDLRSDSPSRKILDSLNLLDEDFLTIDFAIRNLSEEKIKDYSEVIVSLITVWVEETKKYVLILPNNPDDIEPTLNLIFKPLSANIKTNVVFLREKLLPDVAASIYEKSRIVTGMSMFPVCAAIQSGIPVCFLSSFDLSSRAKTIEDMGLKNSIQELDTNTAEELSEVILEINSNYVGGMIESDKAREYAMKKLMEHFDDINRYINKIVDKIEASEKKKKKKKKKEQ